MHKATALASALAALSTASSVHAQSRWLHVDQSAPPGGDGSSWEHAFRDLDAALGAIANTDFQQISDIWVSIAQGTYRPRARAAGSPAFAITGDSGLVSGIRLHIEGSFAGLRSTNPYVRDYVSTPTILSADVRGDDQPGFRNRDDNLGPVLTNSYYGNARVWWIWIDGLQFIGGRAPYNSAGGLHLESEYAPEISNCTFEECEGYQGGGLAVRTSGYYGPAWIRNCTARNNRARLDGGGMFFEGPAFLWLCRLTDNSCRNNGGGLDATSADIRLSVIAGNQAMFGGGVHGWAGLYNSLIVANHASVGGGAFLTHSDVISSTIAGNSADYGGGLHLSASFWRITYSILDQNSARLAGPQISNSELPNPLWLDHVLLRGGGNAIFAPFGGSIYPDSVVFDCDARFVDPDGPDHDPNTWADNDYHLAPGSCAIDRGEPNSGGGLDLDGHEHRLPRFPGGTPLPDLGCYEYLPHCPADFNQDAGVTVDDLLDFLTSFTFGQPLADIDDGSATNTPDDAVTIDDLIYFLARYNAGC